MAFEPKNLSVSLSGSTELHLHSALPETLSDFAKQSVSNPVTTAKFMMENVLLTNPGEILSNPNYGVGLRGYLFNQSSDFDNLRARCINQLVAYVQGVVILDVTIDDSAIDQNSLGVSIKFLNPDKTIESYLVQANYQSGVSQAAYV